MEKFVPFEKLSKKEQKKLNALKRRDWNGINPVTRKSENPKAYNRKRHRTDFDFDSVPLCFSFEIISGRSDLPQSLSYKQLFRHQWV